MLKLKEAPYLLTLVFAFNGILVKYISDEILKSDFIEYDFQQTIEGDRLFYDCTLINNSADKTHSLITVRVSTRSGTFLNAWMEPVPPYGTSYITPDNPVEKGDSTGSFDFTIRQLIPKGEIKLRVQYKGEVEPRFTLRADRITENNILLKEASFLTWVAKHQLLILMGILLVWSILTLIYILWLATQKEKVVSS